MRKSTWLGIESLAAMALVIGATGCSAPREAPNLLHEDAAVKVRGMKQAARAGDASNLPQLVKDLDSDDPAVRLFAITALEHLTGTRLGYAYYFDETQRKESLGRWEAWLAEHAAEHKAGPGNAAEK